MFVSNISPFLSICVCVCVCEGATDVSSGSPMKNEVTWLSPVFEGQGDPLAYSWPSAGLRVCAPDEEGKERHSKIRQNLVCYAYIKKLSQAEVR